MAASTLVHPRRRASVLMHRSALDHALAAGTDPAQSGELALRADQLVSAKARDLLAGSVERLVTEAEQPPAPLSPAAPVRRDEILGARALLQTLASELRAPEPVQAQGVALVRLLLIDGSSVLYEPSETGALGHAVDEARRGLLPPEAERR